MFVVTAAAIVLAMPQFALADFEARIFRYEWPQPILVEAILSIPQLRRAVNEFGSNPGSMLILRYPGGDAGNVWAFEVRDTLIGLGIPSSDIVVEPASGQPDSIQVLVLAPKTPS